MPEQLLARGDRVIGTIRTAGDTGRLAEPRGRSPEIFHPPALDMRNTPPIRRVADRSFARLYGTDKGAS